MSMKTPDEKSHRHMMAAQHAESARVALLDLAEVTTVDLNDEASIAFTATLHRALGDVRRLQEMLQ